MSQKQSLQCWDRMTAALEDDVSRLSESELLGEPQSAERVAALRQIIGTALQGRGRAPSPQVRLPADPRARRELLRRTLRRRPAVPGGISMSFSSPDSMSDSDIDSALRELLTKGLLNLWGDKE